MPLLEVKFLSLQISQGFGTIPVLETFVSLVVLTLIRDYWRSIVMESGEQCVMTFFLALQLMLLVNSWDTIIILTMTIFCTFFKSMQCNLLLSSTFSVILSGLYAIIKVYYINRLQPMMVLCLIIGTCLKLFYFIRGML